MTCLWVVPISRTSITQRFPARMAAPRSAPTGTPPTLRATARPTTYIPEIPWNDACASVLIAYLAHSGSYTTYGSTGFCNVSPGSSTSGYLSTGAASGGASNCATGAGGANTSSYLISGPQCQGYTKPSYQTGSVLTGGSAVYGMPSDGVRDVPDVSMFAANGAWGHYETVCWSDPSQTSGGAVSCSGAPSTWSGFGGTSSCYSNHGRDPSAGQSEDWPELGQSSVPSTTRSDKTSTARLVAPSWVADVIPAPARAAVASSTT